jgi:hypothetical protein
MNFVAAFFQKAAHRLASKIERARVQGRKQVNDDQYSHGDKNH